jgi:hypothetical protein
VLSDAGGHTNIQREHGRGAPDVNLRDREMFPPFFVYGFVFLVGVALGIMAGYWLAGR